MLWLRSLDALTSVDRTAYGNKAAHLGELTRLGYNVPPGFALSAEAFRAHFDDQLSLDHDQLDNRPQRPRLRPALAQALRECFDTLVQGQDADAHYVAVRSSALGEDGEHHSFAGQHATYYYITRQNLPEAVVDCWMSLWSNAAVSYREAVQPSADAEMAVVIQLMVNADSAGVVFTEDPSGMYSDHSLVESTWGLGAALVDGRVSPDQFFVARSGSITRSRIGAKRLYMPATLKEPTAQRLESLAQHKQEQPSLSNAQVLAVTQLGQRIANDMESPQDVEWAYANGELFVLQARPITGGVQQTAPGVTGRWILFKPLAENFTEPLTPMSQDLYSRVLASPGRFIEGRYYLNFDSVRRLLPLRGSQTQVAQALLLRGGAIDFAQISWWKLPITLVQLGVAYLATGMFWHRSKALPAKAVERFSARLRTLEAPEISALQALHQSLYGRRPLEPAYNYPFYLNIGSGRYFVLQGVLRSLLQRWAPQLPSNLVDQLCIGHNGMASRDLLNELSALATLVKADSHLMSLSDQTLLVELANLPADHPIARAMRRFFRRFGHRTAREMELATPRWREAPEAILQALIPLLSNEVERPDAQMAFQQAQETLHQALTGWRGWVVNQLVRRARHYVTMRENTRHQTAAALNLVREKLCQAERLLIHQGSLHYPGDIFFLTWDEFNQLQQGALHWRDVELTIRNRRQERLVQSRTTPPMTINLAVEPPTLTHQPQAENTLVGQCASPGYAEGIARVVLDPNAAMGELKHNSILIAPYTDPGWTPLFLSAAAVVVETGSYLSHAGTVAREFKVPCVVDAPHCTNLIPNGARVRVFADTGVVEIVEPLPA